MRFSCEKARLLHADTEKYGPTSASSGQDSLSWLMNGKIREKIGVIPPNVTWGGT